MFKLSKKIALPLIAVLLIGTGVGGYFLFRNSQIPKYFVDKYPELLEYCDTAEDANGLKVSCKALMLDIKPNVSEGIPSLTSLIITKNEELKEYTIAEKDEIFAWSNDVLQFKKLKPVIINIQYTKINPIKYAVQGITFEDIPETYIQEIVNRDIEEIMGMDKNSTTILNSFDFCPRPEILPDYVIKKEEYAKYWEENILSEEEYLNGYNYNLDDTTIRLLFACDSVKNVGYNNVCNFNSQKNESLDIEETFEISKKTELTTRDRMLLKRLSLFYDSTYLKQSPVTIDNAFIANLKSNLEQYPIFSPEVICTISRISSSDIQILGKENMNYLDIISYPLCKDILPKEIDKTGSFIFSFFENKVMDLTLFNRCINLEDFINENV